MPHITYRCPGLVITDHEFQIPLDHANPQGETITVFGRAIVAPDKAGQALPWLVFFQGGPGGKSPRPDTRSGWLKRATQEYRVFLLDQRGTGRSTPANRQTLSQRGDAQAQASYLKHFRADSIIRDAEFIRGALLSPGETWSIVGQSYGGFCVMSYLSLAPEGLREAFITGGLAPIDRPADDIYRLTYQRVRERNELFFARYPEDRAVAQSIAVYLAANEVRLPNGDPLTVQRFQTLGKSLGRGVGFEYLHYLMDEAFVQTPTGPQLSDTFLYTVMNDTTLVTNPLYGVLHEAIYAQGQATRWSAERVRSEYPEFAWAADKPIFFTGEMIYPWMFEEDSGLRPLREVAHILANYTEWPPLYDAARLASNTVPCAAAIYTDDMYVERLFSEETARRIRGCRVWITNEFQHDGIRVDGETVLGRLMDMLHGHR